MVIPKGTGPGRFKNADRPTSRHRTTPDQKADHYSALDLSTPRGLDAVPAHLAQEAGQYATHNLYTGFDTARPPPTPEHGHWTALHAGLDVAQGLSAQEAGRHALSYNIHAEVAAARALQTSEPRHWTARRAGAAPAAPTLPGPEPRSWTPYHFGHFAARGHPTQEAGQPSYNIHAGAASGFDTARPPPTLEHGLWSALHTGLEAACGPATQETAHSPFNPHPGTRARSSFLNTPPPQDVQRYLSACAAAQTMTALAQQPNQYRTKEHSSVHEASPRGRPVLPAGTPQGADRYLPGSADSAAIAAAQAQLEEDEYFPLYNVPPGMSEDEARQAIKHYYESLKSVRREPGRRLYKR